MKTEDNLESSTLKRRNSIGSSIDSSPTKRNFSRNSEKLQNKSFDDLNNPKYVNFNKIFFLIQLIENVKSM